MPEDRITLAATHTVALRVEQEKLLEAEEILSGLHDSYQRQKAPFRRQGEAGTRPSPNAARRLAGPAARSASGSVRLPDWVVPAVESDQQ